MYLARRGQKSLLLSRFSAAVPTSWLSRAITIAIAGDRPAKWRHHAAIGGAAEHAETGNGCAAWQRPAVTVERFAAPPSARSSRVDGE
jgi:hypothetical protein